MGILTGALGKITGALDLPLKFPLKEQIFPQSIEKTLLCTVKDQYGPGPGTENKTIKGTL